MNKILITVIALNIAVLLPIGFFFYRDVLASPPGDRAAGCTPYAVEKEEVGKDKIRISWKTYEECTSYIRYSLNPEDAGVLAENDEGLNPSKQHRSSIDNLKPGQSYYLFFYSDDQAYGYSGLPIVVTTLIF